MKVYTSRNGHKVIESEIFNCENIWDTFIISDTHFLHRKIAEYADRPDDWQDRIITNWNNVIGDNDVVLHLGDLTFGNRENAASITRRLNGKKYLLKGNHDRRSRKWFDELGFELIKSSFMVDCGPFKILFSHRPVFNLPKGTANIHGHIHNKQHFIAYRQKNLYINASVEKLNYRPIRLNNLMYRSESRSESRIAI